MDGRRPKGVRKFMTLARDASLPFVFETVLIHWRVRGDGIFESKIDLVIDLQQHGYFLVLFFVGLRRRICVVFSRGVFHCGSPHESRG